MNRSVFWLFILTYYGVSAFASGSIQPPLKRYLEKNQAISIGNIGIVVPGIYIVVSSDKNELILGKNQVHWFGLPSSEHQVVVIFKGQVANLDHLRSDYSLIRATLISFEGNEIRFVDFQSDEMGFYRRISP